MNKIKVNIKKGNYKTPKYACEQDSGCDIFTTEEFTLNQFESYLVPTGVHLDIPEGYEVQLRPKSGLSAKGILCAWGTIDNGYKGEIKAHLTKLSPGMMTFKKGEKVGQLVFMKGVVQAEFVEVDELSTSDRGEGGFGHTGKE